MENRGYGSLNRYSKVPVGWGSSSPDWGMTVKRTTSAWSWRGNEVCKVWVRLTTKWTIQSTHCVCGGGGRGGGSGEEYRRERDKANRTLLLSRSLQYRSQDGIQKKMISENSLEENPHKSIVMWCLGTPMGGRVKEERAPCGCLFLLSRSQLQCPCSWSAPCTEPTVDCL